MARRYKSKPLMFLEIYEEDLNLSRDKSNSSNHHVPFPISAALRDAAGSHDPLSKYELFTRNPQRYNESFSIRLPAQPDTHSPKNAAVQNAMLPKSVQCPSNEVNIDPAPIP